MGSSAIRTPKWNADASTGSWQCRSFRGCEASGGLPITCLAVSVPRRCFDAAAGRSQVLHDGHDDLINPSCVLQHHLEEFVRPFMSVLSSRPVFKWLSHTAPRTVTAIQRVARFYYLQQNCFGRRVEGRKFDTATTPVPGLNLRRLAETPSAVHLRLSGAYIEKLN